MKKQTGKKTNNEAGIVEFTRGGVVESIHRYHAVIMDSNNKIVYSVGDSELKTFLRSSAKPLQAFALLLTGMTSKFKLTDKEIAIMCGSHSGEPQHLDVVRTMLNKHDIPLTCLKCGTHFPLDLKAKNALIEDGNKPIPLHHNCSGKHSGMLVAAKYLQQDLETYLDPTSAVQRQITSVIAETAKMKTEDIIVGIDGCSVPAHCIPLSRAGYAFSRLVMPEKLDKDKRSTAVQIVRSMRKHPEMVAGSESRICTELIKVAVKNNFIAKAGAEGYYSAAWQDEGKGYGLVVKVEDGAQRARDPIVIALLQQFNVLPSPLPESLTEFSAQRLRNFAGLECGEVIVR